MPTGSRVAAARLRATTCWTTGPGRGELRTEDLAGPGEGEALVETPAQRVARGTELGTPPPQQ